MLKTMVSAVVKRLYPSLGEREDGSGHCHEAAFDVDSFPEEMRKKLTDRQEKSEQDPPQR